jgi:iron complex transport system substrate-binding protein
MRPTVANKRIASTSPSARLTAARYAPTRRRLLTTSAGSVAGVGLAGLLAACGSSSSEAGGSASSSGASGAWSFTDDRGVTVKLAARPKRVAFLTDTVTAALWAAGLHPVAAFVGNPSIAGSVGLTLSKQGIVQIGGTDFELNLEALVGAEPDLLVDALQPDGTLQTASQNAQVKQVAPIVGINMYKPIEHIVASAENLTKAVGDELADASAKALYQAAAEKLRAAVKGNPGVRVGFVFDISETGLGVMNQKTWPVLQTVAALGVELVSVPQNSDNTYSEGVSWEKVPRIPADLLVWSVNDPLPTNPVWARVPAVAAGQLWKPDLASWYAYSYANFGTLLDGLATHMASARTGVGPTGSLT